MRRSNARSPLTLSRARRMAYLRGKLLEKRRRLLESLQAGIVAADEPPVVPDEVDLANSTTARETSYRIGSVESDAVAQIDYALTRLDSGKYGICEDCGKRIPEARLRAVPFAYLCVSCKERDERENPPAEEADVFWGDLGEAGGDGPPELHDLYVTVRGRRPA